jgi:hypothetical protein
VKLARVKFDINENNELAGVKTMSLVDEPAIESDFIYFSKTQRYVELKEEKYKQVVGGLALIPDKDILRYDDNGDPYYGYFTSEGIERIRNKFHKEGLTHSVNTDHNSTDYIDAYILESFIIDSPERLADVKAKGINEAVLGSWYVAYKIEQPEVFQRVLQGELKGFSVEIFLSQFHKANNPNKEFNSMKKNLKERILALFAEDELEVVEPKVEKQEEVKPEQKLEVAKTKDGAEVSYSEIGQPVLVAGSPAPDGRHELDNGKLIEVESGVLKSIEDKPAEEAPVSEDQSKAITQELEKVKQDFSKASTELAEATKKIEALSAEIEKLKKAPLVNPVVTTRTEQIDLSKLSNVEKERLKYKSK